MIPSQFCHYSRCHFLDGEMFPPSPLRLEDIIPENCSARVYSTTCGSVCGDRGCLFLEWTNHSPNMATYDSQSGYTILATFRRATDMVGGSPHHRRFDYRQPRCSTGLFVRWGVFSLTLKTHPIFFSPIPTPPEISENQR